MDFDFDELEEAEPAAMGRVAAMSDTAFRRFRQRVEEAVSARRFEDFADAVAEAIWDEETVPERMPKVVKSFQYVLDDAAKAGDIEAGAAISWCLWQLGLSTSLHETRVHRSEEERAPVALVTGFGGSDVADLQGQANWYASQGFSVVSTTRAGFPPVLQQKHNHVVAKALRSVLRPGSSVVFHLCSQYGVIFGTEILWMWGNNLPPFDNLPPAGECLKAVVFDCAAPPNFDPATQSIVYPTDRATISAILGMEPNPSSGSDEEEEGGKQAEAEKREEDEEAKNQLHRAEDRFYLNVLLGCTGGLTKKLKLTSLEEMVPSNKEVKRCLAEAARYWRKAEPWVIKCREQVKIDVPHDMWAALQWLDWQRGEAFPRLFLYSKADLLVTPERVEAWMRHTKAYRPEAEIYSAKMERSVHCRLWDTEPEACGAAVLQLLRAAGVQTGGDWQSD